MKPLFKILLKYYLKYITKLAMLIHRPVIIAIAGSDNLPFVKKEIKRALLDLGLNVRANPKNFNTEIGLPLAVLHLPSGYNSYKNWIYTLAHAPLAIFKSDFPKYLVLSLGASEAGDIKYLLTLVKPKIAVITNITQKHLEGFDGINELFSEYEYLIKKLNKNCTLIINRDIARYELLVKNCRANILNYGIENKSDYQALEIEKKIYGQVVKIKNSEIKEYILNKHGQHHVYALLAGLIIKDYAERQISKTEK